MLKPLHFLSTSKIVNFLLIAFLSGLTLFYVSCRKEVEPDQKTRAVIDRNLTIEEVQVLYADDFGIGRSNIKLPLQLSPVWERAYIFNELNFPIILAPVDTGNILPFGGNLAFFRDSLGSIRSCFLTWRADSNLVYASDRAPLSRFNNQFSGWMMMVSENDSIQVISRIERGMVVAYKTGSLSFFNLDINLSAATRTQVASDREWPPCWWPFRPKPHCPDPNGGGGSWWNDLWNSITSVFGQIWDSMSSGSGTENVLISGIYFPSDYSSGLYNEQPFGGSANFETQFQNQMNTCTAIKEYYESIGEIPAGYNEIDIHFCQLVNDLGLGANETRCLFSQYGSAFVEGLWDYWEDSDHSPATAESIKAYIQSQCNGTGTSALAEFLKDQFCLQGSTIEIWMQLTQQCGLTEQSAEEGLSNMSECVRNIIVNDWVEKMELENGITYSNELVNQLFDLGGCCGDENPNDDYEPYNPNNSISAVEPKWGQLATCEEISNEIANQ